MKIGSMEISSLLLFFFGVADGMVLALSLVFQHQRYIFTATLLLSWVMSALGGIWASHLDFRR